MLPDAELPDGVDLVAMAQEDSLRRGRDVLIEECTRCHDLRRILERPRTPSDWWATVERMGEKPSLFAPLRGRDLLAATAYLIAITPDLQRSAKLRRASELERREVEAELVPAAGDDASGDADAVDAGVADAGVADAGVADAGASVASTAPQPDPRRAKAAYQRRCTGCHELSEVSQSPPRSRAAVRSLVRRMVDNGMEASRSELTLITWWLEREYVR
ncbi:MAG: hypothetical protein R3B06_24585 [Kofleriaceae bacterium]